MNTQNRTLTRHSVVLAQQPIHKSVRHIGQVESLLRKLGLVPWWHRDPIRRSGSCEWSWIEIFQRDDFRCVFCGTNLAESSRALAHGSIDHLIPRSVFRNEQEANRGGNLVTSCADCNALKADWRPVALTDLAWRSRAAFIGAARHHIEAVARFRYEKDKAILAMARNGAPLQSWREERQPAIESDRLDYFASPFAKIAGIALRSSAGRPRE